MKQNSESRNRWTGFTCSDQYTPKSDISHQQENEISYSINGLRIFWISRAELVGGRFFKVSVRLTRKMRKFT